MKKNIVIYGASGHGKMIADMVLARQDLRLVGYIDDTKAVSEFYHAPILANRLTKEVVKEFDIHAYAFGIGDNAARFSVFTRIQEELPNLSPITLVHSSAAVSHSATLGDGTVVMAQSTVGSDARIGMCTILNTGAILNHDSTLGDFSSLLPASNVAGYCHIGKWTTICMGACVAQQCCVGDNTVVGAMALVLQDMPANATCWGVPARAQRVRSFADKIL